MKIIRSFIIALGLWLSIAGPLYAQNIVVTSCGTLAAPYSAGNTGRPTVIDVNGNTCISGSFSATTTGFPGSSQTTGTPISVTTGGVTGTLPAGTVVVASNAGSTNTAYCKLGASATTSDQPIQAGSWFAFTVGSATQLTCITSTSTTTVNMVGGAGLPTGAGGGGSSGGGGGAVTVADGADVTQGALADAAASAGGTGSLSAKLRLMTTQLNTISSNTSGAVPAGTNLIGKVGIDQTTPGTTNGVQINAALPAGTALIGKTGIDQTTPGTTNNVAVSLGSAAVVDNPCQTVTQTSTPISITTGTTTRIIAPTASKKTYICALSIQATAADNIGIVEGTGGTCGSSTAGVYGGTTAASGLNLAANQGFAWGNGEAPVMQTAGSNVDFCFITSAATNLAGHVRWVQK